jgi:soluble lytic murein transglycosylase-like protein
MAYQDAINAGINPDYFVRQIDEESSFDPNARGGSGEIGIAQFMPSTASGLGINAYDPVDSLKGAANLMGRYYVNYGYNYSKALAAYNAGSGTLAISVNYCGDNWFYCSTMPASTRTYINKVVY